MAIKDDIIDSLSIEQKINFLILKLDKKVKIFNVFLEEEQVLKLAYTMDLKDVFNKNNQKITIQVVEQFILEIFKKITTFSSSSDIDNVLKVKNVITVNDALEAYRNGIHITTSLDKKLIKEQLSEKYLLSLKVREEVSNGTISKEEYKRQSDACEIFTPEVINEKVDAILSFVVPIIYQVVKRYEVKKVKKDNEVIGNLLSTKIKVGIILIVALYYNIFAAIVYYNRMSDDYSHFVTRNLLVGVNIIFVLALIALVPKRKKKKTNEYVDMIEDFELVIPSKNVIQSTRLNNFVSEVDFKDLCDNFYAFLISKGMLLEHKKIREIFCAMSCNKLILIKNKTFTDVKFLKALNQFLGNETYYDLVDRNVATEQELIWTNKNGNATTSDFINGICNASKHSNNVNVAALIDVDVSKCSMYLQSVINFANNPNEKGSIKIDMSKEAPISQYMSNGKLPIPKNMWFFIFVSSEASSKLPKKLVSDTILLDIEVKDVEKSVYSKELKALSYTSFIDAINKAKEENHISNDLWSKIDDFEELMKNKYNYTIPNNIIRKMESYASCYNVAGLDESISVDSTIANILLPDIFNEGFIEPSSVDNITTMLNEALSETAISKETLNKYREE